MVIVAYAPTKQDSTEVKDQFCQLDCVMHTTNGSGMVAVLGVLMRSLERKYWESQDCVLWDNKPVTTESD